VKIRSQKNYITGSQCSLKRCWKDVMGTLPAWEGDEVVRVDWDDGRPDAITWETRSYNPILRVDDNGKRFLDFSRG